MSDAPAATHADHDKPHAVPLKLLVAVFVALLCLTWVTVVVTFVDLGDLNIWIALAIAVVKAALVGAFFMHLWWDTPFNAFLLVGAFAFVGLFVAFALIDTSEYKSAEQRPSIVAPTPAP